MMHAVLLRDILASEGLDDQWAFANAFHDATAETIEPLYRDAVASDRHRLAEIEAGIVGREYRPDDPSFEVSHALGVAAGEDVDCLRAFMAVVSDLERAPSVLSRPGLLEKVLELGHDWRDRPSPGPSRAQLESIVAG
jgi:hypothetical protein